MLSRPTPDSMIVLEIDVELRGDQGRRLSIERSDLGPPGTPGDRDLLLGVSVSVGGYSATDQAWVVEEDWAGFMSQLRRLERSRQGRAALHGASPGDLELVFAAVDRAGHMAVTGSLGWRSPDGFSQRLEFGFGFDPGLLATVVRELGAFAAEGGDSPLPSEQPT